MRPEYYLAIGFIILSLYHSGTVEKYFTKNVNMDFSKNMKNIRI